MNLDDWCRDTFDKIGGDMDLQKLKMQIELDLPIEGGPSERKRIMGVSYFDI